MERNVYLKGIMNCMRSKIIRSVPINDTDVSILEQITEEIPDKDCFIIESYNIKGHRLVYLETAKR